MSRKSPSGTKRVFLKRASYTAACAICKRRLAGVRPGSATEKSVSRRFGGTLCQDCVSRIFRDASRVREKVMPLEDVELTYRKYVEGVIKK